MRYRVKIIQPAFTFSKSTMETPEQGVKSFNKKDTRTTSTMSGVFIVNFE